MASQLSMSKHFAKFLRENYDMHKLESLEALTIEDCSALNLLHVLAHYGVYTADGKMGARSKSKYFDTVLHLLKSKFSPQRCADAWATDGCGDISDLIKKLHTEFKDRMEKKNLKGPGIVPGAVEEDGNKNRPIYRDRNPKTTTDTEPSLLDACEDMLYNQPPKGIRLETMAWDRLKSVTNFHGAARSGEGFYLRYNNWRWEGRFHCVSILWPEIKTIKRYIATFCKDYEEFSICFLHGWATAMVFGGLRRGNSQSEGHAGLLFHQETSSASYKRSLTAVLGRHTKHCNPLGVNLTPKSFRSGAITTLTVSGLPPNLCNIRSGHSDGTNSRHYQYGTLAGSMPGMMVLAGYPNWRMCATGPSMISLVEKELICMDDISNYIDALYVVNVDHFKKGGRLRPLLEAATAVLIQSHNLMSKRAKDKSLGSTLVARLQEAAVDTKLATRTNKGAVLVSWSAALEEDWEMKKTASLARQDEKSVIGAEYLKMQEKHSKMMMELLLKQQETLKAQSAQIVELKETFPNTVARLAELNKVMLSPVCAKKTCQITEISPSDDAPSFVAQSESTQAKKRKLGAIFEKTQNDNNAFKKMREAMKEVADSSKRNVNFAFISTVLFHRACKSILLSLSKVPRRLLIRGSGLFDVPSSIPDNNKTKWKNAMSAVALVWTDEEKTSLLSDQMAKDDRVKLSEEIAKRVLDTIRTFLSSAGIRKNATKNEVSYTMIANDLGQIGRHFEKEVSETKEQTGLRLFGEWLDRKGDT